MTMPYWAERLRVRMIHELGGYTDEDVDAEIYRATRAAPPCRISPNSKSPAVWRGFTPFIGGLLAPLLVEQRPQRRFLPLR